MKIPKILLLYKKSAYKIYFMGRKSSVFHKEHLLTTREIESFKRAHEAHYRSLKWVEEVLNRHGVSYRKHARGGKIDYSRYGVVITVGGDGTFLEAARGLKSQLILGVNSDPQNSIGRFCGTTSQDFETVFKRFLEKKAKIKVFQRLRLSLKAEVKKYDLEILNDLLICHQNPAALNRYYLSVEGVKEDQRGSGIWIATAAGSTGAIHSAGGKILPEESREVQYYPRELYRGRDRVYQLKGGALLLSRPIEVTSLMRSGMIFVDGAHLRLPFPFGAKVSISLSKYPLKVIH